MSEFHDLTSSVYAYLAGIIDGEGHFHKPLITSGKGVRTAYARIVVVNTDYELIHWLKTTFGGNISSTPATLRRKECFRWTLTGQKAEQLAYLVHPYLIVKRQQVKRIISP